MSNDVSLPGSLKYFALFRKVQIHFVFYFALLCSISHSISHRSDPFCTVFRIIPLCFVLFFALFNSISHYISHFSTLFRIVHFLFRTLFRTSFRTISHFAFLFRMGHEIVRNNFISHYFALLSDLRMKRFFVCTLGMVFRVTMFHNLSLL